MKKGTTARTLMWQLFTTFFVLLVVYITYAVMEIRLPSQLERIIFIILQSFYASITAAVTIVACLIAGLPIRVSIRCNQWWQNKPLIPLAGFVLGSLLLSMSFAPIFCDIQTIFLQGKPIEKHMPNTALAVSGWFLTAFSLLHLYPRNVKYVFKCHSV